MFQSAPPVRGATLRSSEDLETALSFQSAPPVRGATVVAAVEQSIRCAAVFQSAPPVRGATLPLLMFPLVRRGVSIRAPRAGGDRHAPRARSQQPRGFNPRPPCGGRLQAAQGRLQLIQVSIRAPRAGGDREPPRASGAAKGFQSAPPVRGATDQNQLHTGDSFRFQSAPPVRGATPNVDILWNILKVSIRAPRAGGDRGS